MSEGAPTRESLVDGASLASLSTYGWFLRLAREAKRQRALSDAQLPRLPAGLAPERAMRSFWRNRARCAAGGAWGLAKALASQLKGRMLVSAFALLMYTAGTLAQPIILHTLLDELATIRGGGQGAAGDVRSLALAGAMGLTCVANALTLNFFWWHGTCATVDAETSLSGAILHSVLLDATRWRGSVPLASGRNRASTGSMLFRLTRDSNVFTRTFFLCMGQWASWSSLLQLAVSVFFLFRLLRLAAAGALAVLIVQFPLNFLLAWWAKRLLDRVRRCSDARTHAGTAALAAQRAIRLTATEPHVCTTLYELRDREHAALWRQAAVRTINATLTRAVPVLMPVASFSLYAYLYPDQPLTAATAFSCTLWFACVRSASSKMPSAIRGVPKVAVSLRRVAEVLIPATGAQQGATHWLGDQAYADLDALCPGSPGAGAGAGAGSGAPAGPGEGALESVVGDGVPPPASASASGDDLAPGSVRLEAACFAPWAKGEAAENESTCAPLLEGVTASARPGEVVCVVGPVGSGKSALLAGIAGTLRTYGGGDSGCPLRVRGTMGWVPQGPSLFNRSLRANITAFGDREDDEGALRRALASCCLDVDLPTLDSGLDTVVGDGGSRLSGGQAQRSALARCVYAKPDVALLDDVLSGCDAHVREAIVTECLFGPGLGGATRIIATHDLALASHPGVDQVWVVHAGRVVARGTFAEVSSHPVVSHLSARTTHTALAPSAGSDTDAAAGGAPTPADSRGRHGARSAPASRSAGAASSQEARAAGAIGGGTVLRYLRRWGCRGGVAAAVALLFVAAEAALALSALTLASWVDAETAGSPSNGTQPAFEPLQPASVWAYARAYSVLGIGSVAASGVGSLLLLWASLHAATALFRDMVFGLVGATQSFFDATPAGRVENRLIADQGAVDARSAVAISALLQTLLRVARALVLVFFAVPALAGPASVLVLPYYAISTWYRPVSRDLKRMQAVSKSPVVTLLRESVLRRDVFTAFLKDRPHLRPRVLRTFAALQHRHASAFFHQWAANQWVTLWLELLGAALVLAVSLFAVAATKGLLPPALLHATQPGPRLFPPGAPHPPEATRATDAFTAGVIGLALSTAASLPFSLIWIVRDYAQAETEMVAVERIEEMCHLEPEGAGAGEGGSGSGSGRGESRPHHTRTRRDGDKALLAEWGGAGKEGGDEEDPAVEGNSGPSPHHGPAARASATQRREQLRARFTAHRRQVWLQRRREGAQRKLSRGGPHSLRLPGRPNGADGSASGAAQYKALPADDAGEGAGTGAGDAALAVTAEDVTLRYRADLTPALDQLTFAIPAGCKVAVVGRTGAGKSSLVAALLRLYPVGGSLRLGNRSIEAWPPEHVRGKVAVVPQESGTIPGTIRDNVACADAGIGDGRIWRALHEVGLFDRVARLPQQLDTDVTDASSLSAGERQLLCTARALAKRAPLVLLDEATSAIDARSDEVVHDVLLSSSATVVSICHKLAHLPRFDRVMVMERGRVVEFDAPSALLATDSRAKRLFARFSSAHRDMQ